MSDEALKSRLDQAERELRDMHAQLMKLGKMATLGQLVATVAHDINTPLGSIKANAELTQRLIDKLRAQLAGDPKNARALSALDEALATTLLACERIGSIVRSLRNFSCDSELEEVDLHRGLDSSLQLCSHLFKSRIQVERHYAALPAVRCRAGEINQVFMNLLTNAAQAIAGSGTITVTTSVDGDRVAVAIRDDGHGIAPDAQQRLFDSGYTTKRAGGGSGLGLAIAQRIVSDHGGSIAVDSAPGQGATFTVTLPVAGPR